MLCDRGSLRPVWLACLIEGNIAPVR